MGKLKESVQQESESDPYSSEARSISSESSDKGSQNEEIMFSKGTYIAFVDPSEEDGEFKIGFVRRICLVTKYFNRSSKIRQMYLLM